jgi:hypothetical protein
MRVCLGIGIQMASGTVRCENRLTIVLSEYQLRTQPKAGDG